MMSVIPSAEFGFCACGQPLPSRGATRCPQCRAAHARAHVGKKAQILKELPRVAPPRHEAAWIACNVERKAVDWETAPSLRAVNGLSALKKDEKLRRAFWLTVFKPSAKRPG